MPIYEYQCKSCRQVMEVLQKMSDAPLKKCPECGGKVSKLMSMNTFHLKGSGWYVTDYNKKNGPSASASKSESTESKPETKTESKPSSKAVE